MACSSHYAKAYLNQCHSFFIRLSHSEIKILRNHCFPKQILTVLQLFFWHYVVQLFLVRRMCEIFHHFLLSSTKIACATDEIKLLLSLSGKQSQNPCYQSLAVN